MTVYSCLFGGGGKHFHNGVGVLSSTYMTDPGADRDRIFMGGGGHKRLCAHTHITSASLTAGVQPGPFSEPCMEALGGVLDALS